MVTKSKSCFSSSRNYDSTHWSLARTINDPNFNNLEQNSNLGDLKLCGIQLKFVKNENWDELGSEILLPYDVNSIGLMGNLTTVALAGSATTQQNLKVYNYFSASNYFMKKMNKEDRNLRPILFHYLNTRRSWPPKNTSNCINISLNKIRKDRTFSLSSGSKILPVSIWSNTTNSRWLQIDS